MNLYKIGPTLRRDPLGLSEAPAKRGSPISEATACKGYLFDDIGLSASSSSGANAGDSKSGDFLVGSNKTPVWVWIVALVLVAFFLLRKR